MRAACLFLACLATGCTTRLVAMAPLTAPASSYDCAVAEDPASCTPAAVLDPAAETVSGGATILLPPECRGSFDTIVVRHRRSARRDALVTCGEGGESTERYACAALPDDFEPSLESGSPCLVEADPDASARGLDLALPAQCDGLANQLIVERLRSGRPSSFVVCAPPDNEPGSTP